MIDAPSGKLEAAIGDGTIGCMPCEEGGLIGGRRSLYAARDLEPDQGSVREALGRAYNRSSDIATSVREVLEEHKSDWSSA